MLSPTHKRCTDCSGSILVVSPWQKNSEEGDGEKRDLKAPLYPMKQKLACIPGGVSRTTDLQEHTEDSQQLHSKRFILVQKPTDNTTV